MRARSSQYTTAVAVASVLVGACASSPNHDTLAMKGVVASASHIAGNQRMMPAPMAGGGSILVPVGVPDSWVYKVSTSNASLIVRSFRRFEVGSCVEVRTAAGRPATQVVLEPSEATVAAAEGC